MKSINRCNNPFPGKILRGYFILVADYGDIELDNLEVVGVGDLQGRLQDVQELAQVPVRSTEMASVVARTYP